MNPWIIVTIILAATNGILVFLLCLAGKGKITSRPKGKKKKIFEKTYYIESNKLNIHDVGKATHYQYYPITKIGDTIKNAIIRHKLKLIEYRAKGLFDDDKLEFTVSGERENIEEFSKGLYGYLIPNFSISESETGRIK